jgi:hypothetical protein
MKVRVACTPFYEGTAMFVVVTFPGTDEFTEYPGVTGIRIKKNGTLVIWWIGRSLVTAQLKDVYEASEWSSVKVDQTTVVNETDGLK